MKYQVQYLRPLSDFDCVVTVLASPNWLEQQFGRQRRVLRFYGSGTCWRVGRDGPRCSELTSEWLHGVWNRQWNLRVAWNGRPLQRSSR